MLTPTVPNLDCTVGGSGGYGVTADPHSSHGCFSRADDKSAMSDVTMSNTLQQQSQASPLPAEEDLNQMLTDIADGDITFDIFH